MRNSPAFILRSEILTAARPTPTGNRRRTSTCSPANATCGSTTTRSSKKATTSSLTSAWLESFLPHENKTQNSLEIYSRIWCFQYGQSWPPCGPQLSSEWRIPLLERTSDRRYVGPLFSHEPVPVEM